MKKMIFIMSLLIMITGCTKKQEIIKENYLSSTEQNVELYDENYNKITELPRGTKVIEKEKIEQEEENYIRIIYEDNNYLVKEKNLNEKIVQETNIFVKIPCILYENETDGKIIESINKGEQLEIIGYDKLENGKVNMYKVKHKDKEGYVYEKYLNQNEEEALKNYDNGYFEKHLQRNDILGGGNAAELDYHPYEKPKFKENIMPEEVNALYINREALKNIDEYIEYAKQTKINSFVVDIKENTAPTYKSEVMKKLSPTNYENAIYTIDEYKEYIKRIKDNGFYVIGRITTFKDNFYAEDNKEDTIYDKRTNEPFNHNDSYWPSAYSRQVWYFNVELAKEAVSNMGFNEIQFDYVRFPDRTGSDEEFLDYKNIYNETKAQALQNFVMYASDEIHKLKAYVSIDVFAECAHEYVTAYGQYLPALSNVADVISPMPYPDHFNEHQYGIEDIVWTNPYKLIYTWSYDYVQERQKETTTPAIIRTWIQTYDTIREPYITYDNGKIEDQIQALYDAGLKNGYITWNSGSSMLKYKSLSEAFNKNYKE